MHVCDIAAYSMYFLMPKKIKKHSKYIPVLCLALLSPFPRLIIADNQLTLKCTALSGWMHHALQRKEAEESACGKVHDPAFKITEIYFQEKLLCNFLVKNGNC